MLGTIIKAGIRNQSASQVLAGLELSVKALLAAEAIQTLITTPLAVVAVAVLVAQGQTAVDQPLGVEATVSNLALLAPALTMAEVAVVCQTETTQLAAALAVAATQMLQALRILAVVAEQKQLEAPALLS
jgi:hypothetical protein